MPRSIPDRQRNTKSSYRVQATFALGRALDAVTRVLEHERRDKREVIVLITGGHGPRLGLDAMNPTPESGRYTLPVWLAIRWPADLTPGASPKSLVNVYRTLFDRVFGMSLPPLPDRAYVSGFTTPYDLIAARPQTAPAAAGVSDRRCLTQRLSSWSSADSWSSPPWAGASSDTRRSSADPRPTSGRRRAASLRRSRCRWDACDREWR
jgi:hypothetical protein